MRPAHQSATPMSANGNHGAVHTELSLNTIAVHGGPRVENERGSAVPPIYQSTTFLQRPEDIGYEAAMYHRCVCASTDALSHPKSPFLQLPELVVVDRSNNCPNTLVSTPDVGHIYHAQSSLACNPLTPPHWQYLASELMRW